MIRVRTLGYTFQTVDATNSMLMVATYETVVDKKTINK